MRERDGGPRRERQGDERRRGGQAEPRPAPVEAAATGTPDFAASLQVTEAERVWIRAHLGPFQKKELILDVLRRVKAGKEATVYVCSAHPNTGCELIAAKVYRERSLRSTRNQGHYQQGRGLLDEDGRSSWRPAGSQKSKRAKEAIQTSWLMHEFTLLETLHAQGGDVPRAIEHGEQALLMEFIGDGLDAAPTLNDVEIESSEAQRLFERVIFNVELMLGLGWIHGDLSPYNLLYHHGRIVLIDFPQVVDCQNNPRARGIFERDIERVTQYFERVGWSVDPRRLAAELWSKYVPEPDADDIRD
jgi:RIO kinase 1